MGEQNIYLLMHKDIPVTMLEISQTGDIIHVSKKPINIEHLPIITQYDNYSLSSWWEERAIPSTRDYLSQLLATKGMRLPKEYLLNNLGLSLTDCYWVKPIDSDIMWKDVNFYTNSFKDDTLKFSTDEKKENIYTPNSSLGGNIEKTWSVKNQDRYLIKGNRTEKSSESINEVIASEIHKKQEFSNYAAYELLKIEGKRYDYGCMTKAFTSEHDELITAYDLLISRNIQGNYYDGLITICKECGMDIQGIREQIDYMIMSDYIMSQTDRHFNNIGFLRDPDTLILKGLAPIYDNGNSMYYNSLAPQDEKDMEYLSVKGFTTNLEDTLKLVNNYNAIDLTKLPPVSFIKTMYANDSKADSKQIDNICYAYERRIDRCRNLQLGLPVQHKIFHVIPKEMVDICQEAYNNSKIQSDIKRLKWLFFKNNKRESENVYETIVKEFEKSGYSKEMTDKYLIKEHNLPQIVNFDKEQMPILKQVPDTFPEDNILENDEPDIMETEEEY